MKDNYSKRRLYLDKKVQNNSYSSPYNSEKNRDKDIKLSKDIHYKGKFVGLNADSSKIMKNANNRYSKRTVIQEDISLTQSKINNYLQKSNDNIFKNNKFSNNFNYQSLDKKYLNNSNNNSKSNNNNKSTNINNISNLRYYNYMQKKPDYSRVNQDSSNPHIYIISDNQKYYNEQKNRNKKVNINNYDYKKIFKNQTYDFSQSNYANNSRSNNKEEKKIPLIIIEQKNRYHRFPTQNIQNENNKIIKIQSVWRGYYLRKVAVGSIKKYIGFVALMKYSEVIFNKKKKSLLSDVINLLKKYINSKSLKSKYRKINRNNNNDNNTDNNFNNNNNNKRRYRNFNNLTKDKNKKENNTGKNMFKNNYLFNNVELEPVRNSYNNNKINSDNNRKGVTIYFINKEKQLEREKEKEQRKKEKMEREKDNEKRRFEREQRIKEHIERDKKNQKILEKIRIENEKREKDRIERREKREIEKKERDRIEKEKKDKELKERLEKLRIENEKKNKEKIEKERIEKERIEKERIEKERKEKERIEKERKEKERIEKERKEKERIEKERIEKERKDKIEKEKKERIEKEKRDREKREKERIDKERKEKERIEKEIKEKERIEIEKLNNKKDNNNYNNNDDDIFSKPIKIIYIPKKITNYRIKNKSYLKRITRDKKNKIVNFMKLIYRKYYTLYYPILLYHLRILAKLHFIRYQLDSLKNIFNIIQKKKLKKWLKIYRENVLNEKVKEEILKKNFNIFKINKDKDKDKNNNKTQEKEILKTNIINNSIKQNQYEFNDIILENENEDELNSIEEKIILRGKKKILSMNNNNYSLLKKIINKKIDLGKKNNCNLYNKYFKIWKNNINESNTNDNSKRKIDFNLHSPDMELRGKSKKKHIKVRFTRAITSKTSIGSIKSEGKSNSSSIQTKKMRIKNVVVKPSIYLTTTLINNSLDSNIFKTNQNKKAFQLLCLLDKIDNKIIIYKSFTYWKKKKK